MTADDKVIKTLSVLEKAGEVVTTEKMDGECTTLYTDYCHARSLDSGNHPSRDMVKSLWGSMRYYIPPGWRICGENLYAKHSIGYTNLPSYFLVFSVWDANNMCLSWDDTVEWSALLDLTTVPVMYRGSFSKPILDSLWSSCNPETTEGYVVRVAGGFAYPDFRTHVAKYVREGHVQTDKHWTQQTIIPNRLHTQ